MATLYRQKFIQRALANYPIVDYDTTDCIGFVKLCAKEASAPFSSIGSNWTWRHGLKSKGMSATGNPQPGDVVFRYYTSDESGYALPSRYATDSCQWDVYHIGILVAVDGNTYTVCHSSGHKDNGRKDVFKTKTAFAKYWQLYGTLNNTQSSAVISGSTSTDTTSYVSSASPYPDVPFKVKITTEKLNFRVGPGKKYARIAYLPLGEYTITKVCGQWGYTSYNNRKGYIMLNNDWMDWT